MNEAIKLILSLSLSGSILAGLLFALKPFLKHKISKSLQYYVWVVVLLRLVLPFSFEESIMNKVFYYDQTSATIISQEPVKPTNDLIGLNESNMNAAELTNIKDTSNVVYNKEINYKKIFVDLFNQYALYILLIGSIVAFTVNVTGYVKFKKYIKSENRPATDEEKMMLSSLLISNRAQFNRCMVGLVRNRFVATPMLIGIVHPCIILPDIGYTEKQLKNILLHEITHLNRFDILIKWLALVATSLHWFNPLIYFIKKEVNHACELACDEAVIKNLNTAEKQDYGDTLISLVAENKYPVGVLQATMCEEKKTLKERLVAIMAQKGNSKIIMIFSVILLAVIVFSALYLGAGVGSGKKTPPRIYINAENSETKVALTGSYSWSYRSTHVQADSDHPTNFKYNPDNIISVTGQQQLVLSTQNLKKDKKYDFTIENIEVYQDGKLIEFESVDPSFMNSNLYLQAPKNSGEYIYCLNLNYKDRGTVSYGFVVRVNMPTYDLTEIAKYQTPYVGNHSKVVSLARNLPVPDPYFKQQYISLKTENKPYGATIYHEPANNTEYQGVWPIEQPSDSFESILEKNVLVLFCMIDNVEELTFAFRNSQSTGELDESQYESSFTFSRASFREKYGDLSVLSGNLDLLQDALSGRILSAFKGLELYVWRRPELTGNDDLYYTLLMGTNRNKTESEIYDLNAATSDLDTIKKELSSYRSDSYLFISHSEDIDKGTMEGIADKLSGTFNNGSISIGVLENSIVPNDSLLDEFTDEEVEQARGVVEESGGSFNEGDYTNWSMILIRNDKFSPWLIDDQGY